MLRIRDAEFSSLGISGIVILKEEVVPALIPYSSEQVILDYQQYLISPSHIEHSDVRFQAGQAAGQAQMKKDDMMDQASQNAQHAQEHAAGVLQQTGEQMKSMAQSAADTVKNAVGMGDAGSGAAARTSTTTTTATTANH